MVSKVTFKMNLRTKLKEIEDKDAFKEEVGNYIVEQILEDASNSRSSVSGKLWKGLSKDYKAEKAKISGSLKANLELHGNMLDSLTFKKYRDGIEVGFFDKNEAQKADNHNKFSSKSKKTKLPKRQSIPKKNENFRKSILNEIDAIKEEFSG